MSCKAQGVLVIPPPGCDWFQYHKVGCVTSEGPAKLDFCFGSFTYSSAVGAI